MSVKDKVTPEEMKGILDACYDKAIHGILNVSKPIDDFAIEYLDRYSTKEIAAKKMLNTQVIKCTASGVITGFGGLITLPVAVPANVSSVLYIQLRMLACTAYMAGYDVTDDEVQTLIYACLVGVSVSEVLKKAGIKVGEKVAVGAIEKIPGKVLTSINQTVGFRLLTKFGETGVINLGKMVPGVGALINGGFDYAQTKLLANRSYNWFFNGKFEGDDAGEESFEENIIDVEVEES